LDEGKEKAMRGRKEIDALIDRVIERKESGKHYWGMSYEEGVRNALEWVLENTDDDPLE
jgi:hypothetical protein